MTNPTKGTDEDWASAQSLLNKRLNRERVNRHHQRQRELGRVQRKIWIHPEDSERVRKYIDRLNKEREK